MSISNVVLILGKRLRNNQLTSEGLSRVEALVHRLDEMDESQTALVFCGGVTGNQIKSEADVMYQYFLSLLPNNRTCPRHILLEGTSTNTIENIENAADKLIESGLCHSGQEIRVTFVSSDYHLKRIFEIQDLMDEQGLLRVLKERCADTGLMLSISLKIADHYVAPYPHSGEQGNAFLRVDELTTYRVYLEGVKNGSFQRELTLVRAQPLQLARHALKQLKQMLLDNESVQSIEKIERAVEMTTPCLCQQKFVEQLGILDKNLTWLNRHLDPERLDG